MLRCGAEAACRVHIPEDDGSTPSTASKYSGCRVRVTRTTYVVKTQDSIACHPDHFFKSVI